VASTSPETADNKGRVFMQALGKPTLPQIPLKICERFKRGHEVVRARISGPRRSGSTPHRRQAFKSLDESANCQ
jgi:hypothetical protein